MRQWKPVDNSPLANYPHDKSRLFLVHFFFESDRLNVNEVGAARFDRDKGWCYVDGTPHIFWGDKILQYQDLPKTPEEEPESWYSCHESDPFQDPRIMEAQGLVTLVTFSAGATAENGTGLFNVMANGIGVEHFDPRTGWQKNKAALKSAAGTYTHWRRLPDVPEVFGVNEKVLLIRKTQQQKGTTEADAGCAGIAAEA